MTNLETIAFITIAGGLFIQIILDLINARQSKRHITRKDTRP